MTWLMPPGAPIILGADDTVERRSGGKIGQGLLSRCGALDQEARPPLFGLKWVSMMLWVTVPWARRVWALLFFRAVLARSKEQSATAPDQRRSGPADDEAAPSLVPRTPPGLGGRWRLCGGLAGAGLREIPGGHGLAPAVGCRLYHQPGPQPPGKRGRGTLQKGSANGACRPGRSAPIPPGRTWQWIGTEASVNTCGDSLIPPCGLRRVPPVGFVLSTACGRPEGKQRIESLLLYRPAGHPRAVPTGCSCAGR